LLTWCGWLAGQAQQQAYVSQMVQRLQAQYQRQQVGPAASVALSDEPLNFRAYTISLAARSRFCTFVLVLFWQ
jgi:hypothetical protein